MRFAFINQENIKPDEVALLQEMEPCFSVAVKALSKFPVGVSKCPFPHKMLLSLTPIHYGSIVSTRRVLGQF